MAAAGTAALCLLASLTGCAGETAVRQDAGETGQAAQAASDAQQSADGAEQTSDAQQPAGETGQGASDAQQPAGGAEQTFAKTPDAAMQDSLPAPTSYLTAEDMLLADGWPSCNDAALAAVMRKAEAGETVTVALIGGSITQGTISNGSKDGEIADKKPYADIFEAWWQERFPDTQINFINAGIGGTDSYLGVHRLEEDVLSCHPDLVLVEFSVNDADTSFYKKSYDNLVRNILQAEGAPAAMLLYMAQTNGATAQAGHVLVGFRYELPMLSYANVIKAFMESGRYDEKELSGDGVHPSALGHAVAGEMLWNYLNAVYEARMDYPEPEPFDMEPVTVAAYEHAAVLDSGDIVPEDMGSFAENKSCEQFPDGWSCTQGDGAIVFRVSCERLGVLYLSTVDGQSGQFEVYVDGEAVRTINADFEGGWGNAITAEEVFSSKGTAEHTVEIRKSPDSTGDVLHLLGLLVS